jgi:hypothetical protein
MTAQPSILDVMADLMADLPVPVRRELHVSDHVWRFLRETYATVIRPEAVLAMLALPIIVDASLTGGQWQIRENGEVTSSGDMAPPPDGMLVFYTPRSGWVALRKDLAPIPAGFTWTTP